MSADKAVVSIYNELRRRNVFRVGAAYLAGAWLLIQLINELSPLLGLSETFGRAGLIVLVIGFLPALIAAWVFELTPQGLQRDSAANHDSAHGNSTTRGFDRAIIAVLALAVVFFAVDRFVLEPARDAQLVAEVTEQARGALRTGSTGDNETIAVLAFDDMSQSGDQEYFSDGISVELMDLLARIPGLVVTAPESVFSFKGSDVTYPEIGAMLNVAHLLDGTVRVADDRIRVTARLVDAATGNLVWSYTPEARPITDVFAIQEEIATDVVEQLRIALAGELPTLDQTTPEVHSLVLQADHIDKSRLREGVPLVVELLEQAVDMDDRYLPARIGLAVAYRQLGNPGPGQIEIAAAQRLMRETIEAAASVWPDRIEIKQMRAFMAADTGDFATSARYLEAALAQDAGHFDTLALAQGLLTLLGRLEQSRVVGEQVVARNPLCGFCNGNLVRAYFETRRFDAAIETAQKALALGLQTNFFYGLALLLSGDAETALTEFQREDNFFGGERLLGSAMALHALGRLQEFETAMTELIEVADDGCSRACSMVYAYVGAIDKAFEYLDRMSIPGDADSSLLSRPFYDSLRDDPRWEEFVGRWPADPREAIEFNLELSE